MRSVLRRSARSVGFGIVALVIVLARPPAAAAECPFVPPWPPITIAIPSAEVIVVGDVIADFDPADLFTADGGSRTEAFRITTVIRGDKEVGELLDIQWMLPNWPWDKTSDDTPAYPSCSHLQAVPGETIALAIDALQPGVAMQTQDDVTWYQPPTRYNAMGVLVSIDPSGSWGADRERVTLSQLRELAGLPATDISMASIAQQQPRPSLLPIVVGLLAAAAVLLRRDRDRA